MTIFKKILFLIFLSILLIPSFVSADITSKVPQLNPICWEKNACAEIRKSYGVSDPVEQTKGCISEDPCKVTGYCKCLPAGITEAKIAIGGESKFIHLGSYIMVVFNYAIMMVGVIATLVIVVAGLQWLTSGGNSDTIGRAKKRMGGAIMGMFLAYGSIFILNQINPALTTFRLPQVWLLKPQSLMPTFCSELTDSKIKLAQVASWENQISPIKPPASAADYKYSYTEAKAEITANPKKVSDTTAKITKFYCGNRFLTKDGGSTACFGDFCAPSEEGGKHYANACTSNGKDNKKYICEKGNIFGKILVGDMIQEAMGSCAVTLLQGGVGWDTSNSTKGVMGINNIVAVCNNGYTGTDIPFLSPNAVKYEKEGSGPDKGKKNRDIKQAPYINGTDVGYNFSISNEEIDSLAESCNKKFDGVTVGGGLKGFVMSVVMKEACWKYPEPHFIGQKGVDLGDTTFFLSKSMRSIDPRHYFTVADLKKGIRVNLDVSKIYDIDGLLANDLRTAHQKAGYAAH